MNKLLRLCVLAGVVCAALLQATPAHAGTQDFTITSFSADYYLTRDAKNVADLKVEEHIVAQFPSFDQNHGILRAIPKKYQDHSLELDIQKVTDATGKSWHYETDTDNDNLVLKIGDANTFVHGPQTYNITYTMRGVTRSFSDHDEFYWDINGDQWPQPFDSVTARIHLPQGAIQSRDAMCYAGAFGSLEQQCTVTDSGDGTIIATTTQQLQPYQTLSVVVGFAKGTFAGYQPSQAQINKWILQGMAIAAPALFALIVVIVAWRRGGRDPKGRAIIPQYVPPKDASVLVSDTVLNEGATLKALSATIIDLAVRHYIKIYELKEGKIASKSEYELELVKDPKDLREDDLAVVYMLFKEFTVGRKVNLADLKNKLATQTFELNRQVTQRVTKEGYFRIAPDKARRPYLIAGGVLIAISFFAFVQLLGLLLAGIVLIIGSRVMPARTQKGVELREYLLGMRDYMQLAEAERLKVLQSPHGELTEKVDVDDKKQLVKLYERLLPYAMLFGIEKDWAKQFADLYEQPPDWYHGNTAFNAVWFASSIGSFSSASAVAFTPPSSSSGSGFGGGAGGGGGGGGGGGW